MKIWFEPHATSLDNEAGVASGWNDVDLSAIGTAQAAELTSRCRERGVDLIFCSDLQRAVKTAIPAAEAMGIPIYVDKRLRECDYGDFTQKQKDLVANEKSKRIDKPFPNGESYSQVLKRMGQFIDYLKTNFKGKTVLIIGHRATHYGLDYWISGRPLIDSVTEDWQWQPGWEYELE